MSEFSAYTSIDQNIASRSSDRITKISVVNDDIFRYINPRNFNNQNQQNLYSRPYITEYDDKYNKKNRINNINFKNDKIGFIKKHIEFISVVFLVLIAIYIRMYNISSPKQVVFDEVHFGGFANKYIKGTFFMDVHPPLAKIMFAFVGLMFGYHGDFSFKEIGLEYNDSVPYVAMRVYSCICGILLVPIAYFTMRGLNFSKYSSFFAGMLVIFENALATQSRLILLDSQLILFAAFTLLAWVYFIKYKLKPWSFEWWYWLAMTGLGLGLTSSVKWIGLFIVAAIGLATIKDLWEILGDTDNSIIMVIKHFMARALCLIALPIAVYAFFFALHFALLTKQGTAYSFMSPEFQMSFDDSNKESTYYDVAYNSNVYIRHVNTNGGYLHSHRDRYPNGSKEQQVTLYGYADSNSEWTILPEYNSRNKNGTTLIKNGATVRLQHSSTLKYLRSNDIRPPMSDEDYQNEVCGTTEENPRDNYNNWVIEIVKGKDNESKNYLKTYSSEFRIRHRNTGCYLFSHNVKLPSWGFGQQEVTCGNGVLKENTIWRIEKNNNPNFNEENKVIVPKTLSFIGKLIELNKVMFEVNSGLTESHPYESKPLDWILMKRGVSYWGSTSKYGLIYLLINPIIWAMSTLSIVIYLIYYVLFLLIKQKKSGLPKTVRNKLFKLSYPGGLLFTTWATHYLPFFLMGRQLFLHHYLPAIYFTILLSAVLIDEFVVSRFRQPITKMGIYFVILFMVMITYVKYSPIIYGKSMNKSRCESLKLRNSWDINCSKYT